MDRLAESFLGRTIQVLVMGETPDGLLWGRSAWDSPDIDGGWSFPAKPGPGTWFPSDVPAPTRGIFLANRLAPPFRGATLL